MSMDDEAFTKAHMKMNLQVQELIGNGVNPLAVAGILQALATQLYRALLTDDDFDRMMATVIDSSKELKHEKVLH